jgi:hypothetical protein
MFRGSTAHHQEVRRVYVANGTSKMTVMMHGQPDIKGDSDNKVGSTLFYFVSS